MNCIICGNWFASTIHDGACPTCSRVIKQLRLNMTANRLIELAQAEKDGRLVALPPNVPLTLEELREMDGEPVWGAFLAGRDCYMIIQWHNCEFFKSYECGFLLAEEYGKTWFAYRRKPERNTTEDADTCQKTSSRNDSET